MTRTLRRPLSLQVVLGTILVFTAGTALRIAPRYWTSLPFNPDGFKFASQAERIATNAELAIQTIGPHGYTFPTLLSQIQLLTGTELLWLTQPVIAVIGVVPCLLAVAVTRRLARRYDWDFSRIFATTLVAGLILVFQGLFLRRTVWVHYEVLGLVFF